MSSYLQRKDIQLTKENIKNDYPLITCGTSCGKTYFAVHELANLFEEVSGDKIEDILMLTPTAALRDNTLSNYPLAIERLDENKDLSMPANEKYGRIKIACFSTIGNYLEQGNKITHAPQLVIVDEADENALWSLCFSNNLPVWDWLISNHKDIKFCGLTATPQLLTEYVKNKNLHFVDITPNYKPALKIDSIEIVPHTSIFTYLKTYKPKAKEKTLIYTRSAKDCVKLSRSMKNAGFIVSQYNNKEVKLEDGTYKISQLLKEQLVAVKPFGAVSLPDYICGSKDFPAKEKLPPNIDTLFINDAAVAGVNIKDKSVKTVIVDSADLAIIEQARGRIRTHIDKLVIIYNRKELPRLMKSIEVYSHIYNKHISLNSWHTVQQLTLKKDKEANRNASIDILSYIDSQGKVKVNMFAEAIYNYQNAIYSLLETYEGRSIYFNSLQKYTSRPIRYINAEYIRASAANKEKIVATDIENFLDRKLFKEDKEELVEALGLVNNKWRKTKWPTVKKALEEEGFLVREGRTTRQGHNLRYTVITAATC